jgi:2,4-dienoyl-CoA reductase-like NADH-dependent reductase (Old Yellow Enzyme family)
VTAIDSLYTPFNLKSLTTDNRIVMAPMTRNQSPDNIPTDDNVEYYRKRAAGGVGLIVTRAPV